jgi:beta propeller repeat protein
LRQGNQDIYGYNLAIQKEFQITTDESDQWSPAVYGDIIVWTDLRQGNLDIYGYNLATQEEFQITTDANGQASPAIYGDIAVWLTRADDSWDIYGFNLATHEELQILTSPSEHISVAICEDITVWDDSRNGNWDIYGYNLATQEEFQITDRGSEQTESSSSIPPLRSLPVSYTALTIAIFLVSLILSVYFLRRFVIERSVISLAWSSGFVLFIVGIATCIHAEVSGSGVGNKSILVVGLLLIIFSAYTDSEG